MYMVCKFQTEAHYNLHAIEEQGSMVITLILPHFHYP